MFARFFIDHPRFAMVIAVVMALAGIIAGISLPVKQYPDVAPPQVSVEATFSGADAETLAKSVGVPLEEAINGVDGMIYMSSTSSSTGYYRLNISFATGIDIDMALVKVQNRVQQALSLLPKEVVARGVTTRSQYSNTLAFVALESPKGTRDALFLTDYASSTIKNALKRVPGIGDVSVLGARYSIRVWVDPERLEGLGLSAEDVANAIATQNIQASLGTLGSPPGNETPLVYTLITRGRLGSVRDFENIVVRSDSQGGMVKLNDVATVELGAESYSYKAGMDGRPSAMMLLTQASGSNAMDAMKATEKALEELSRRLPEDTRFVLGYDSTEYVRETIHEIVFTLGLTFLLVVLVCYVFLQDWRVTLVPILAIPISLLATFIGLKILGFSINILTLFAFVLIIGTVVDDAIIVVERVLFIMHRDDIDARAAAIQAMKDVTGPMTATTLVFLAIFVPVTFMGGITGVIYRQFAVTVSFSVVFSLVVALTLSPAMCAQMFQGIGPKVRGPLAWFNSLVLRSSKGYVKCSVWIARRTFVLLGLFALILGLVFGVSKITPSSFLPEEDQGVAYAVLQLPEGASRNRTHTVMERLLPHGLGHCPCPRLQGSSWPPECGHSQS